MNSNENSAAATADSGSLLLAQATRKLVWVWVLDNLKRKQAKSCHHRRRSLELLAISKAQHKSKKGAAVITNSKLASTTT